MFTQSLSRTHSHSLLTFHVKITSNANRNDLLIRNSWMLNYLHEYLRRTFCDLQKGTHQGEQVETLGAVRTFYKATVPLWYIAFMYQCCTTTTYSRELLKS